MRIVSRRVRTMVRFAMGSADIAAMGPSKARMRPVQITVKKNMMTGR
jgi:hypothetical protein